jgi:hypothetical protein
MNGDWLVGKEISKWSANMPNARVLTYILAVLSGVLRLASWFFFAQSFYLIASSYALFSIVILINSNNLQKLLIDKRFIQIWILAGIFLGIVILSDASLFIIPFTLLVYHSYRRNIFSYQHRAGLKKWEFVLLASLGIAPVGLILVLRWDVIAGIVTSLAWFYDVDFWFFLETV